MAPHFAGWFARSTSTRSHSHAGSGCTSADATALHALTQQRRRAIAAHFVLVSEGGLHVADIARRGLPRRQAQGARVTLITV
jgi:hypothetical protein